MHKLEDFLAKLEKVKLCGEGKWQASCPAHDDRSPSLSITSRPDGTVLVYCHSGCTCNEITAAVGLTPKDLFPDTQQSLVIRKQVATRQKLEGYQLQLLIQLAEVSARLRGESVTPKQRMEVTASRERIKQAWEYV